MINKSFFKIDLKGGENIKVKSKKVCFVLISLFILFLSISTINANEEISNSTYDSNTLEIATSNDLNSENTLQSISKYESKDLNSENTLQSISKYESKDLNSENTLQSISKYESNDDNLNNNKNYNINSIKAEIESDNANGFKNSNVNNSDLNPNSIATAKDYFNEMISSDNVSIYSALNTYYVGVNKTTNGIGTSDNPFANLKLALTAVSSNDQIIILSGNYSGTNNMNLTITQSNLKISAENNAEVNFDGNGLNQIFIIKGNNILLNGINFINSQAINFINIIEWTGTNGTLNNCTFYNCSSNKGGNIYWKGINGKIENSKFINCSSEKNGPILLSAEAKNATINNSEFINCTGDDGGAVFIKGTATILNSTFTNNHANSQGGAIALRDIAEAIINNCNFINNSAEVGGGLKFFETSKAYVNNSYFANNTANKHAGSICHESTNLVTIENTKIYDSSSNYSGGIHAHNIINLINITLENCNAIGTKINEGYGGAISLIGNNSTLINITIKNSSAKNYGAGIEIKGNNSLIENITINNCSAYEGAGIRIVGENTTITNTNISDCLVSENGAGIYILGNNSIIKNSILNNSNATVNGGGMYIIGSNTTVQKVNFTNNNAIPNIYLKYDGLGGGLYIKGNNTQITDSTFDHNTGRNGSAIYNNGMAKINNTQFKDNQAWIYLIPTYYNGTHIYSTLYGGNNILNAIYNVADFEDIFIDGINPRDGVENSKNGTVIYQDTREFNQTIITEVYDKHGELIFNNTAITDLYGKVSYPISLSNDSWYIVHMTHLEDTYYKEITNTTALNIFAGLNIGNITMYEKDPTPQNIYVILANQNKNIIPYGYEIHVYVKINGTYYLISNESEEGSDENGLLIFNTTEFKNLPSGKYELFANYTDEYNEYMPCNVTGTLDILPLEYHINKTVINEDDIFIGDIVSFNITVTNDGNSTLHNIVAVDLNMPGLELVENQTYENWTYTGHNTWTYNNNIAGYKNTSFIVKFLITQSGNLSNIATVTVNNGTGTNQTNVTFNVSEKLHTNTTISNETGTPNETIEIEVNVSTENGSEFNGEVTVNLPDNTSVIVNITNGHGVLNWTIPFDANNTTYPIFAEFKGNDHYYPSNSTGFVNVTKYSDTSINKTVNTTKAEKGDYIEYTITVSNNGPQNSENIIVIDQIPNGFISINSSSSKNNTNYQYFPENNTFVWKIDNLNVNDTLIIKLVCLANTSGNITNFVSLNNIYDPNLNNNNANVTIEITNTTNQTNTTNPENYNNSANPNHNSNNPNINFVDPKIANNPINQIDKLADIENANNISLNGNNDKNKEFGLNMQHTGNPLVMITMALLVLLIGGIKRKY